MKRLQLSHIISRLFLLAAFALTLAGGFTTPAAATSNDTPGAVYTMTNAAGGNEILAFARAADGSLTFQGAYATGGLGSGAGLGSQTAVILSKNSRWLFVVNAGSNQISVFAVSGGALNLVGAFDSGGERPVSLTVYKDLLYVLNAGGSGSVTGFTIQGDGALLPIPGSTQPVSNGGAGAALGLAQVAFNSSGDSLVVTEKSTNLLGVYPVDDGVAGAPAFYPSAGAVPFGFAFDRHNHAIVSEASGSVSSYAVEAGGLEVISPAVINGQAAACWIAISKNGKFAYTTNAASGTISSYRIAENGALTLLDATAAMTGPGSTPLDMAFSNNGRYLYTLAAGSHTIAISRFSADGSLADLGAVSVPAGAAGLAAH